jgi:phage-related protein
MTQPTFAFPCEYGLTATRKAYSEAVKFSTTASGAVPAALDRIDTSYEITTVPIDNDTAVSLDGALQTLKGSFFYSQFYFDDQQYKYRIVDDTWGWQVIGPTANIFTFQVEEVKEPTVEFSIDYGESQENNVSVHIFRVATTSGTATPSITSRRLKVVSVRTRPMSKTAASNLEASLLALNGSPFYSQIYLDSAPRLYRLQPYQWTWTPESADGYVASFTMAEVIANSSDIPCVETLNLQRTSRVKTVQFGDGYQQSAPDGINTEDYLYTIETLPLSDAQSLALEAALSALKGNFFYSRFRNDAQVYKYRLDDSRWSWSSQGKDSNVFSFTVKRAYDL